MFPYTKQQRLGSSVYRCTRDADGLPFALKVVDLDAVDAIRQAAQRHDVVVLRLRDPAERDRLRAGFIRGREAETGRSFVGSGRTRWRNGGTGEHAEDVGRRLARAGAGFLMLDVDRPVLPPLRHFLAARTGTGGGRA